MPCRVDDDGSYSHFLELDRNQDLFGVRATTDAIQATVACDVLQVIEKAGLLGMVSALSLAWWENHKRDDAARIARLKAEREDERRQLEREHAEIGARLATLATSADK